MSSRHFLPNLVYSQNIFRLWVYLEKLCNQIAHNASSKCVQDVSVLTFSVIFDRPTMSLKICPGCECILTFSAWLIIFFQICLGCEYFLPNLTSWQCLIKNMSSVLVCSNIFCQTWWADSLYKMYPVCKCTFTFTVKFN